MKSPTYTSLVNCFLPLPSWLMIWRFLPDARYRIIAPSGLHIGLKSFVALVVSPVTFSCCICVCGVTTYCDSGDSTHTLTMTSTTARMIRIVNRCSVLIVIFQTPCCGQVYYVYSYFIPPSCFFSRNACQIVPVQPSATQRSRVHRRNGISTRRPSHCLLIVSCTELY